jgi:hypothetical protein
LKLEIIYVEENHWKRKLSMNLRGIYHIGKMDFNGKLLYLGKVCKEKITIIVMI